MSIGEHTGYSAKRLARGATIIVPQEYEAFYTCTVPVKLDKVCGKQFGKHERSAFEAHVGKCCAENADAIKLSQPSVRREILHGIFDKDLERWLDGPNGNRQAVIEGRKRM